MLRVVGIIDRRLKDGCSTSTTRAERDLSAKRYVYIWADGIHLEARLEDEAVLLVLIGATPEAARNWLASPMVPRERARLA